MHNRNIKNKINHTLLLIESKIILLNYIYENRIIIQLYNSN